MNLKELISKKFKTNEQKTMWWIKFAAVRRRRVWRLSEQQNHRCCYCSRQTWVFDGKKSSDRRYYPDRLRGMSKAHMATLDHIIPTSKDGSERLDNAVMACHRCNHLRGDMSALGFWDAMQDETKLRALLARRRKKSRTRSIAKKVKRESKRNWFAVCLAWMIYVSPEAKRIADEISRELKRIPEDCQDLFKEAA